VRNPLSDRRDDDGALHDYGEMGVMSNSADTPDRRDFLLKLGAGAGAAAIGTQAVASLRSLVPNVSYDAPTTVKLGAPIDFPEGLKFLPDERLFVFRQGQTFHAISATCTHLGCTVRAEALSSPTVAEVGGTPLKLTHRFQCPCHGSQYTGDGANVAGPAPRPLAWYRLSVAADDGQLVVDLADEVDRDFRLTLA
jgi:menaquinol-cytochrome c reductase iron-sulfur subunit